MAKGAVKESEVTLFMIPTAIATATTLTIYAEQGLKLVVG
jgi:hypothetical protein